MTVATGASPCIVCGNLTVRVQGNHEICPVCGWQDDGGDYRDPDRYVGGPNHVTLREARQNYEEFGASERRRIDRVRLPLPEEVPPPEVAAAAPNPSWLKFVDNPEIIRAVYGKQAVPELDGITVREICWHWEGPSLLIRFDLPTYPDNPPHEWRESHFDTAQVELRLLDAAAALEAGQDSNPVGSITLSKGAAAPVHATLDAERFRVRANAQRAYIQRLSGSLHGEPHRE
ncbi:MULTISPECIES: CPCC family cysteine-rich protein [Streptomyces]|uniref:CPCC family cysteine-rich protein n=1 Tax=Streptomyces TaxID=1883 RepID=UPI002256A03F|nr:CPCC family cysteine-rich protein [Streptomyces virginiae]MCX4716477.1 CPCC family cysteine-rich protein [Streptomyces virginiae]MCX5274254.1 CPCC family cysteine-rich protein [Streptomyces virginiae]